MLYVPPTGSTDPNASYIGKNVAAGTQGSKVPPRVLEAPQREILSIITAAQALGLDAPSNTDLAQMLKAVRSGLLGYSVGSGSPDAVVIAPQPIYTALLPGMRFRVKIPGTAPSTTVTPTLTVNGITAPIRLRGGGAPAVGDVVNGTILTFDIDDVGNARFVTTAPSEVSATGAIITILNSKKISGRKLKAFVTPGSTDFSVAANTTFEISECRGPGGGGGGAAGTASAGSGGGGGGNAGKVGTATVDTVLTMTVGSPGTGGVAGGGNGTAGTPTSVVVKSGSVTDSAGNVYGAGQTFCAATAGQGGTGASGTTTAAQGGAGGVGGGGDFNDSGDAGGLPQGQFTNNTYLGGEGGASPGSGGQPGPNQGAAGNGSSAAGIGGNGSSSNAPGANGAPGRIKIYS